MLDFFQYDFMQRAFAAGLVIGVIAPMIGMFLVMRRYAIMADTLAHVSLAGIAAGLLVGISPIISATVATILAALGIERLRMRRQVFGESALALFLSGSLAVAVVLLSLARNLNVSAFSFLFGSITTVEPQDVVLIFLLGTLVVSFVIIAYRPLFAIAFDEELAEASGIATKRYNRLLVILASITVALSIRIVGALLIGALMVIPVLTALQFSVSFKKTIGFAVGCSMLAVIAGLLVSFYLGLASGGSIVCVALLLFGLSLLVKPRQSGA